MRPDTLSERLSNLFDLVEADYDVAWDLCCDHGFLGTALLSAGRAQRVHFVDQVPGIMTDLQARVLTWPPALQARARLHTARAESLRPESGDRQLVVLAGVGGEKSVWIVNALTRYSAFAEADWILSPANDALDVRHRLAALGFGLVREGAVTENGWCHEYLMVSRRDSTRPVPEVGEFWDPGLAHHRRHLRRLRKHFHNQLKRPDPARPRAALKAYADIFEQLD